MTMIDSGRILSILLLPEMARPTEEIPTGLKAEEGQEDTAGLKESGGANEASSIRTA